MTKATSETTKLNFITDQGSTRATVKCACRAVRFDFPFRAEFRITTGPSPTAVLPASALPELAGEAASGAAEPFADVPDRTNVRAGDDDSAGASGISHANAAGETDCAGGTLDDGRPEDAPPDGPGLGGTVRKGEVSAPHGFAADSAGSAAAVVGRAGADGGKSKLNADESSAGDCSATLLADVSQSGSGSFGRLLRDAPMVSEGSAGTPSAMVSSAAERPVSCARAGLPLDQASLAEASLVPFPAAGAPLAERPAPGVPSDTASSGDADLVGADLAAVGCCGGRLDGTVMPFGCASCSSPIRSSPVALDVTTVR